MDAVTALTLTKSGRTVAVLLAHAHSLNTKRLLGACAIAARATLQTLTAVTKLVGGAVAVFGAKRLADVLCRVALWRRCATVRILQASDTLDTLISLFLEAIWFGLVCRGTFTRNTNTIFALGKRFFCTIVVFATGLASPIDTKGFLRIAVAVALATDTRPLLTKGSRCWAIFVLDTIEVSVTELAYHARFLRHVPITVKLIIPTVTTGFALLCTQRTGPLPKGRAVCGVVLDRTDPF